MSQAHPSPAGHHPLSTATGNKAVPSNELQHPNLRQLNSLYPSGTSICIIDQDSLLHILYLCRPVLLDEDVTDDSDILQGGEWTRERWWYKLAHVCRRWRYLILGSAHHLSLSLVCSPGTPVAEMLEHSPPLPLIIDYVYHSGPITTEDKEGIMLALKHRERVRRIRLDIPVPNPQELIMALEDEFPILEFLFIGPPVNPNTILTPPKSFRAPHLRNLMLTNFALPIRSPLLMTTVGLVTLWLDEISSSAYFHPNDLVHWLSQMPQLEVLGILFHSPVPNRDIKRALLHRPLTTQVALPNVRWFAFGGASSYLEALLPCMVAPLLSKLQVEFFNQLTFDLPHLLQFLNTAENLRFSNATLIFWGEWFSVIVYPNTDSRTYALHMDVSCRHLDWQVASATQIFNVFRTAFSTVEDLTLEYWRHKVPVSSEWRNDADRTQWRDLLRSFGNVKTLQVASGLISHLSHPLQLEDGESPLELLPELKELPYYYPRELDYAFKAFIDARRVAGRPVTVVHR